jgi:sulfide:quinone oxidoreductase
MVGPPPAPRIVRVPDDACGKAAARFSPGTDAAGATARKTDGHAENEETTVSHDTSKAPDGLRVLIVGGGVAALETMLALRALAEDRVDVELLAPESHFWYRPLAVAEPFELGEAHHFELAALAAARGVWFTPGKLAAVEPDLNLARTTKGLELRYDALVLALGARAEPFLEGALTFRGPADTEAYRLLLADAEAGNVQRLVFTLPGEAAWPLPAYELALLTATRLTERGVDGVEIVVVTPESRPLGVFGAAGSEAIERLLSERGIVVQTDRHPLEAKAGVLRLAPEGTVAFDRLVALPRLRGWPIEGIPQDRNGFVATDGHGQVEGVEDVYAAGDITSFPVKQGGLAAQQADAVAEAIADRAGARVRPRPFRPVLRGLVLTGGPPAYLRAEPAGGAGETSAVGLDPLWWPPGKIVGRYLAPFLAEQVRLTRALGQFL